VEVSVVDDFSYVGSGSAPDQGVPDKVVMVKPRKADIASLARRLRLNSPSVFCRIKNDSLLFHMRTLLKNDLDLLDDVLRDLFDQ
jgi:L-seryl-tRNA(Ser) seleniumtransferase